MSPIAIACFESFRKASRVAIRMAADGAHGVVVNPSHCGFELFADECPIARHWQDLLIAEREADGRWRDAQLNAFFERDYDDDYVPPPSGEPDVDAGWEEAQDGGTCEPFERLSAEVETDETD